MVTFISEKVQFTMPQPVADINCFRQWVDSPEFPEYGRIWWLCGEVWADMSGEQIFTHLAVKNEFSVVLGGLVKAEKLGRFLPDGLLLTNFVADISGKPDATFISYETLDSDRIRLVEGATTGYVEIQGTPDMVLEVVSDSSEQKDTLILRKAYWEAGIREYWLVDARTEPLTFDILRHTARGYVGSRKQDDWVKSAVFGKSFRFKQIIDRRGYPDYTLQVK